MVAKPKPAPSNILGALESRETSSLHKHLPNSYSVADMFCGCGGLSLGFTLTRRFHSVFGCEIKPEAVETYVNNHESDHGKPTVFDSDIRGLSDKTLWKALKDHDIHERGQLTCMIGGPPCEGFSQNRSIGAGGKPGDATRVDKFIDDPRNSLFKWFVQAAAEVKPAVVLIENVPDLVRHRDGATLDEVLRALAKAGYRANVRVLNAADYGVPQMRRRAFFLAQRIEDYEKTGIALDFPAPTHVPFPLMHNELNSEQFWLPGDAGYWTTVREAIADLPSAYADDEFDHSSLPYPDAEMTALRRFLRDPNGVVPYNHIGRKLGKSGLAKVKALKGGERFSDLPDAIRPKAGYHYSYARLKWAEPARTITKFAYHVGSGMFTHPEEDRAITMREAARLQTFPDSFRFYATNIRELSSLVGSAVPPLLAFRLAQQVVRYLDQLAFARLPSAHQHTVKPQTGDAVMRRLESAKWSTENFSGSQVGLFLDEQETLDEDCD